MNRRPAPWKIVLVFVAAAGPAARAQEEGQVVFVIQDAAGGAKTPCRIHLLDAAGRPVKKVPPPFWHDHFVCDGEARVPLPPGEYRYEIERGPEYFTAAASFRVERGKTTQVAESLRRIVRLADEGWRSGETHVHRPLKDVELLMRAEDLDAAGVITWWNDANPWPAAPAETTTRFDGDRFCERLGGEDERGGGALLFFGLRRPLPIAGSRREAPASARWLAEAKAHGAWVDAEKPFWRDFPIWLASGMLDSVGVAHNHMHRGGVLDNEAWGRPRDRQRFPGPLGNGHWTQTIYYHALDAGYRLPPSAGSASGVLPNPVGYNRVYVLVDGELTRDKWAASLRAGRAFVTNGPLLRVFANGKPSGEAFQSPGSLEITLEGKLDSRDPIAAVELVHNGRVEQITLPHRFTVAEEGWFLVRALADVKHTFRFASTGPWYVEQAEGKRRMSRASCEFFRDWTGERLEEVRSALKSEEERRDVLPYFDKAHQQWNDRVQAANAE